MAFQGRFWMEDEDVPLLRAIGPMAFAILAIFRRCARGIERRIPSEHSSVTSLMTVTGFARATVIDSLAALVKHRILIAEKRSGLPAQYAFIDTETRLQGALELDAPTGSANRPVPVQQIDRFSKPTGSANRPVPVQQIDRTGSANRPVLPIRRNHEESNGNLESVRTSAKNAEDATPKTSPKRPHFFAPSLEEVQAWFNEQGCPEMAEPYWEWFELVGWVVGKARVPMKNWQLAAKRWIRTTLKERPQSREQRFAENLALAERMAQAGRAEAPSSADLAPTGEATHAID